MTDETSEVSQGSPPESAVAVSGGAASLTAAMNAVLKAVKPLDGLEKAQAQASARRNALWETFTPMCALPNTEERVLIERFVQKAEVGYLDWLEAYEAAEGHKRNLQQAEQELQAAKKVLKESIEAAGQIPENKGDGTMAAAQHMLSLLERRQSQVEGEVKAERKATELTAEDEMELTKLRNAAVDYLITEVVIQNRHATLSPLVSEVVSGARLNSVPLPVRPLEEEIVRYLSNLENNLQRQQEHNRRAHPLLKERLTLLSRYAEWNQAWDTALKAIEALEHPALHPHIWALKKVIELVGQKSAKPIFEGHYTYDYSCSKNPDSLEIHDRAKSTAVEKDEIEYLRKQMRVVAFAVAHREEATYTLKNFVGKEVTVTPSGVEESGNWAECLQWYETLRAERDAAELETLSRATKIDLLKNTVEHFTEKATDEMKTLYKSFNAMIPRNGPTPSNELRKLLDQAAWICKPLEKERDHDRY